MNLNINEIKDSNKENDNNNENNKENDKNNSGNKTNKNNISKIIEEISFNDDTLLINLPTSNPNDTIYHKKVKKDYPKDLKNLKKKEKEKEKENSIIDKSNIQTTNEPQTNILASQAPPVKSITTKKIDISELKSPKTQDIKTNNLNNFSNSNNISNNIINFSDNRSVDNDRDNYNTNYNKNEILINFNKRISGHKKTVQVGANTIKSDKKIFMKQNSGEKSPNPIMMSRSPGRMLSKSKLAGFYNFVPYDKNNKKKLEANQNSNLEKTLINKYDFTNRNKYNKNTFNFNDENDTNTEYSSNLNERRTSFCISKAIKKTKTINKDNNLNNNLIKKINSSKFVSNENPKTEININNNTNLNNLQINKNNNTITSTILNNSSNSYENKSKKELQDIINNQLKNNIPNFSRINMNGYGMQYLCSYLHKNPKTNYKEIKLLGCNLNDDDLFILTRTLLDHEIGLLVLNLSSNKITDDSASNILDLLKDCKSLKGLSLYNNLIGSILKEKLKEYAKLGRSNFENVQLYI